MSKEWSVLLSKSKILIHSLKTTCENVPYGSYNSQKHILEIRSSVVDVTSACYKSLVGHKGLSVTSLEAGCEWRNICEC